MSEIELISLDKIRRDSGTQSRAAIDPATVTEYRDALVNARNEMFPTTKGWPFPPVSLFYDGTKYHLSDGFHRTRAAEQEGWFSIPAVVRQGTQRDALLDSVGANADHGLRRTPADKRRAVTRLLEDAEWGKWSDREIARYCKVSHRTVAAVRAELEPLTGQLSSERAYTTKHGTTAVMNTARIGKGEETAVAPEPDLTEQPLNFNGEPLNKVGRVLRIEDRMLRAINRALPTVAERENAWLDMAEEGQDSEFWELCRPVIPAWAGLSEVAEVIKTNANRITRDRAYKESTSAPALALPDVIRKRLEEKGQTPQQLLKHKGEQHLLFSYISSLSIPAGTGDVLDALEELAQDWEEETAVAPTPPATPPVPAARNGRWIDSQQPMKPHERVGMTGYHVRAALFRAACQHGEPNAVLVEWAEQGPDHPGWPESWGTHPTQPNLSRVVAEEIRLLMEYGILQSQGPIAAVDSYAYCSTSYTQSVIDNLAKGRSYDVEMAARSTGLEAEEIVEAAQWLLDKRQFDLAAPTPAPEPEPEPRKTYTDANGTTYHRRTIVNDQKQVEHSWEPEIEPEPTPTPEDETLTVLLKLRGEANRLAATLRHADVGVGCIASLARAGVKIDDAILSYNAHRKQMDEVDLDNPDVLIDRELAEMRRHER